MKSYGAAGLTYIRSLPLTEGLDLYIEILRDTAAVYPAASFPTAPVGNAFMRSAALSPPPNPETVYADAFFDRFF